MSIQKSGIGDPATARLKSLMPSDEQHEENSAEHAVQQRVDARIDGGAHEREHRNPKIRIRGRSNRRQPLCQSAELRIGIVVCDVRPQSADETHTLPLTRGDGGDILLNR
jgi:hypothetical protein